MALTTIQYGSVASSEVINGNFSYLDERITNLSESLSASISTLSSNIATINSSIASVSEAVTAALATQSAKLEEYKTKTKLLVKNSSNVPNWSACRSISFTSGTSYTAEFNGFVLFIPASSSSGNIAVNENTIIAKISESSNEYASELITVPVKAGDVISTTITVDNAYFIPAAEISVNNF